MFEAEPEEEDIIACIFVELLAKATFFHVRLGMMGR